MSLPDAITAIADAMEKDAPEFAANGAHIVLRSFARELRTAVKAAEGSQQAVNLAGLMTNPEAGMLSHRAAIEAAKKEFRKSPEQAEANDEQMVAVVGGPADDTHAAISAAMPVGAKMSLAGAVYVLEKTASGVQLVPEVKEVKGGIIVG